VLILKTEKFQIQGQTKKTKQAKPKTSIRRLIIKIRDEIYKTETIKTVENIKKAKSCFFEKIKEKKGTNY
jgi:hypothetical protein